MDRGIPFRAKTESSSEWKKVVMAIKVKSEVRQGSVIGPTTFVLFVNDMSNEVGCNIQLFADDAPASSGRRELD